MITMATISKNGLTSTNMETRMKQRRETILMIAVIAALLMPAILGSIETAANPTVQTSKAGYLPVSGGDYQIDPAHSIIGFAIRHLEINWVEGRFKDFSGTIHFDEADITKSSVEFTAKAESVDTGVEPRNKHLRTADFFDAAKYPELSFKSTRVERKGQDDYVLYGDLTLKGVTKPVVLPFTVTGAIKDPWGNARFGIEAHAKINRRDYGINWGKPLEGGGIDVGNEVTINLHLEALKPAPKPAGQ